MDIILDMYPKDLAANVFHDRFGQSPKHLVLAPGRVNLLGEHVDYNDGWVMPAAIDRATWLVFSPVEEGDGLATLVAVDFAEQVSFNSEPIPAKTNLPEWARYPVGVAWAFRQAGLPAPVMLAAYASDVPRGAGLSSSASVEMAFGVALQTLAGQSIPAMQMALLGQKAENDYVGVNCGIMDQFASACGLRDHLLLLDCRSLAWRSLPLPDNLAIVIADTSVRRKLTVSAYNTRRQACEDAVRILSAELPGIRALRDVSLEAFNRFEDKLPGEPARRARHVVEELDRVQRAIPLLEQGDIQQFGRLMNECHASLRDLYEVSIPELDAMAEIARELPGCYGARLTGAGFGGCTVNLVAREQAETFSVELARRYQVRTNLAAEVYICRASDGARLVD